MKIQLESPFKEVWKKGYLVTNKEPRRNVILFNSQKDRTTISYARYLMSVSCGKLLDRNLVVDHINNNKLDDRLENFQLISIAENNKKSARGETIYHFICPVCKKEFTLTAQRLRKNPCCSRSCGSKKVHLK